MVFKFVQIYLQIILYVLSYIVDDCLYLYYVCTDKLGTWPENKQKCFQTFENCQSSLGNTEDNDYTDYLPSTTKPIVPSTTEKQPPQVTNKVPIRPPATTKPPKITTTTEVK